MKVLSLIIFSLFLCSCQSVKIPKDNEAVIIMQKTPCMGTCPEYEIKIYSNKKVVIEAIQHIGMKGVFVSKLSVEAYDKLIDSFESSNFFDYKNEYTSNITDLPTTNLTFRVNGKEKKITDYHGAPESLKALEAQVHTLIKSLEWVQVKEN